MIEKNLEEKIGIMGQLKDAAKTAKFYLAIAALASAPLYLASCGGEPSECCKNMDCPSGKECVDCPSEAPCSCYCRTPPDDDYGDRFMTDEINLAETYCPPAPDAGIEINPVEE